MGRVEGRNVIVTGAAGGQGAHEARLLAAEGATVIATDLSAPELDSPGPGRIIARVLDVTDELAWAQLATFAAAELGAVHGLVNNAGIPMRARVLEVSADDFRRALEVNLVGALFGIQAIAPLMVEGGAIVNVSSAAGLGGYHAAGYTASKWGLRGLSRVASLELGPRGIRVNAIFPGFIETPMTDSAPPAFRDVNVAQTPLGRVGRPGDVAPLVVFLLADESAFISGAEIAVDGGQTAHGGTKTISDALRAAAESGR
jgi:3alpha(or 20beta)-hydroxysteroid dehydrogenase